VLHCVYALIRDDKTRRISANLQRNITHPTRV